MVNVSLRKRARTNESSKEDDSDHEYQVEAVVDKRVRGKKTEYLLKWEGYSNSDNTWEEVSHLNCPQLIREFEERLKQKKNERSSTSKKRSSSTRSKNTNMHETDEDDRSDATHSMVTDNDLGSTDTDDDTRVVTRQSPRKKHTSPKPTRNSSPATRRPSNRKVTNQTKSRITTMCKTDSSDNDEHEDVSMEDHPSSAKRSDGSLLSTPKRKKTSNETSLAVDDEHRNQNNNNSVDLSEKSPTKEININEPTTINLRLHITPSSTSSISLTLNDSDNNNNNNSTSTSSKQHISTELHVSEHDADETIDETDQVEKIEAVRRNQEGIAFRIKLIDENQSHWVPSKIANRKYPQAVIAFWEGHVEFT